MSVIAEVVRLHVAFRQQSVVHDVTFTLPDTGITVLVGRSGSGKTTLLRTFNRLNEEFPDSRTTGTLRLNLGKGLQDIYAPTALPL
ncbi:MAG: ATP-binding cassette domain-containing protein, partial [Bilophila sp.]